MNDITGVIERYVAIWNETDAARRRDLIAQTLSDDATYVDPLASGDGHDGFDRLIQGVQTQFPGYRLHRTGEIDRHHDRVRFAWGIVDPTGEQEVVSGIDFAVVAGDGRLQQITGFFDRVALEVGNA